MDPLTLAAGAAVAFFALKSLRKDKSISVEAVSSGFEPLPPQQQGEAWWEAVSRQWMSTGPVGDSTGRIAHTMRGAAKGDPAANRPINDQKFRSMMAQGYRVVVSTDVFGGEYPYLAFVPDGFLRSSLPAWGELRMLFAPAPGSFGAPATGPLGDLPPGGDKDPLPSTSVFGEIKDASTRQQVIDLYENPDAGLLELEETAVELDKAGYKASAAALRERRKALALQRQLQAKARGGWLYVVRHNDLPFKVAQHYGGVRPKALQEMASLNPTIAANNWKGWHPGEEILLPGSWPDPTLKGLPPLAGGTAPTPKDQGGTLPGTNTPNPWPTPWGPYFAPGTGPALAGTSTTKPAGVGSWYPHPTPNSPTGVVWGPNPFPADAPAFEGGVTPALFKRS